MRAAHHRASPLRRYCGLLVGSVAFLVPLALPGITPSQRLVAPLIAAGSFFAGAAITWLVLQVQVLNPLCSTPALRRFSIGAFYFFGLSALVFVASLPLYLFVPGFIAALREVPPFELAVGISSLTLPVGAAAGTYRVYSSTTPAT